MRNKVFKENPNQVFHLQAKKSLGQNFLNDQHIIEKIATSINSLFYNGKPKYLHEIGPGSGSLTQPLLNKGIQILALEKDQRAVDGLNETLVKNNENKIQVIQTDILKWSPQSDSHISKLNKCVCVGNLPYYISSDILFWFCKFQEYYTHGVFMLQNEVADRLNAKPGTKDYGRLTVRIQLFFDVQKLFEVPASCFVPKPKVDSAIVKLTPKNFSFSSQDEDNAFGRFTAVLFSARRKMLRRALAAQLSDLEKKQEGNIGRFWKLANSLGVTEETRPDNISPQVILEFHKFFLNSN
ncbi:16S rRNA (adenine(1518)-N(6)/adenine(1519)-N(6))-dimethyltransferase RsmA [Silvanigrella aquatica]|uniref:Ribosomal RNA small subunit methyltransferase A n=1 Tax=Silvanigrella aquatica TaxID=1915309 RepID=A0A1L4D3F6_9BACT|nr:16S rRNA (adenine(1518)-N(6)/adenine(1519)-N(6))-dimethyltransferase RsmA [Silvanigrella aquatica]APJ04724.1 ribosomal RNA small subunit methyltransferase A [Silvanigrella aquatica]